MLWIENGGRRHGRVRKCCYFVFLLIQSLQRCVLSIAKYQSEILIEWFYFLRSMKLLNCQDIISKSWSFLTRKNIFSDLETHSNLLFVCRRYDDDLDEVEEEDHFEDVDDLEVSSARNMGFAVCIHVVRGSKPLQGPWHCVLGQDILHSQHCAFYYAGV